jgi:hypothetical protein
MENNLLLVIIGELALIIVVLWVIGRRLRGIVRRR